MKIFGTFGTRGIVNKRLTPKFALKIGLSFGSLLKREEKTGKILLGRDTRTSGEMISNALISGLHSCGFDVIDVGITPTPSIQLSCRRKNVLGGVIITASHNPAEYNGIKLLEPNGMGLKKERERKVEEIFEEENYSRSNWRDIGNTKTQNILENYKNEIINNLDTDKIENHEIKIIVDCGNGSGCFSTPYILRKIGCDVRTINSQPDGFFPGRNPEPTEENLKDLKKTVPALNADLGVAHDGDADRAVFVDEDGNFIEGDKTFGMIVNDMIGKNDTVVTTVATSSLIDEIAEKNDGKSIKTAVGDLIVSRKLNKINGKVGGEENGGVIFPEMALGRDGAMTAAKIVEILTKKDKSLSRIVSELPNYTQFKSKINCPENEKKEVMEKVNSKLKEGIDAEFDETDGLKAIKEDGWVIVRPSGTEPLIRCFSESKDEQKAKELLNIGLKTIKTTLNSLKDNK